MASVVEDNLLGTELMHSHDGGDLSNADIPLSTTNFETNLSGSDDTVQKAFDTLDNILGGGVSSLGDLTDVDDALAYTEGNVLRADGAQFVNAELAHSDLNLDDGTNPHSTTKTDLTLGNVDNVQQMPLSYLDTDGSLTANSDSKVASQKAAKTYVDAFSSGIVIKMACRAATTAAGTLATSFENGDTIDDVVLATGDRILIKDQADQTTNGIYTVNASGAPTRATDYDASAEVGAGTTTFILEGTANAGYDFAQITPSPTLGASNLVFTQKNRTTTYTGSLGVEKSGADFRADLLSTGALGLTGNELKVNVDASSIEIATNALQVKALGITNAMLAGSIADSKLSEIGTANKVNATAFKNLSGTPAGAGVVPIANLATGSPDGTKFIRDDGTLVTPSVGGAPAVNAAVMDIDFVDYNTAAWTNQPAAATELPISSYSRRKIDLTYATHYRILMRTTVFGFAGADLNMKYTTSATGGADAIATYSAADTGGAGECDFSTPAGYKVGAWAELAAGAKADVWLAIVGKQGNAVADPNIRYVIVQFKMLSTGGAAPVDATYLTTSANGTLSAEVVVDADLATFSLPANTTISTYGASIIDDANEATFKATVNLEIGTDVQAYNSNLTGINQALDTTASPSFAGLTTSGPNAASITRAYTVDGNTSREVLGFHRTYNGGTGADGIGAHFAFYAETETEGVEEAIGTLKFATSDATAGTIDSYFEIAPIVNSAAFRYQFNGLGQFGLSTDTDLITLAVDTVDIAGALHTTNLLADHIGEHTDHGIVVDNNFVSGAIGGFTIARANDNAQKIDFYGDASGHWFVGTNDAANDNKHMYIQHVTATPATYAMYFINGNAGIASSQVVLYDGSLQPYLDSDVTLGVAAKYYSNIFSDRATLNATAYLDGANAGRIGITGTLDAFGMTAGNNITLNENSLIIDGAISADEKWSGIVIPGIAAAALAVGDLIYLNANSDWDLADADAASTSGSTTLGICVLAAAGHTSATNVLLYGTIASAAFPAFTAAQTLFVSTTAGDITATQPSGTDDVIRVVGHALSATDLLFQPAQTYWTHT